MNTRLISLLLAAVLLLDARAQQPPANSAPRQLGSLLFQPNLWGRTLAQLNPAFGNLRFRWVSSSLDTARTVGPDLVLGHQPVDEALLRFRELKLTSATVLYYSRGDSGELPQREFEPRLAAIQQDLTTLTGQQPTELGQDASSAVHAQREQWETTTSQFLLDWSFTRASVVQGIPFRAEFIRLTIQPRVQATPAPIGLDTPAPGIRNIVQAFVGTDHIIHSANGDVILKDIPMVDQGQKGYCVVASVERVMRYFGTSVDEDELAQMGNTDTAEGTSTVAMAAALNKLTARLGVRVRTLYMMDSGQFVDTMAAYNHVASRERLPQVTLVGEFLTMDDCFRPVKADLYKQVRLKKTSDFGRFQREIQRSIDEGIPLLWSVELGLVPEKGIGIGSFGGHMRLIIGYNTSTNEIIFSNSWGAGFEVERMPMADAWTITMGLQSLQPISS